jgi:(E)-4-hydroxy-3-methylbut-2-enyl-diphosphate synthase
MDENKSYPLSRSREITIGNLKMGASHPVVVQSMANTNTLDLPSSLEQFKRIADSGSQMVRFTTQGMREVDALKAIIDDLPAQYRNIPVVADVHFRADVAIRAAEICHKVRINPGNFAEDRSLLVTLIGICKKHNTALRIGVNHGSLSKKIMLEYGDTPEGMVESAMGFLRICRDESFHNVVVSLKSSNTILMIHAVRLLQKQMAAENLSYPVHLGVTESGNGEEGRIKSVVGMAPLLSEGIGDTLRVSLTEPPENELPVARLITRLFKKPSALPYNPLGKLPWDPFHFSKRAVREVLGIGGSNPPVVISAEGLSAGPLPDITAGKENSRTVLKINGTKYTPQTPAQADLRAPCFLITDPDTDPRHMAAIQEPVVIILDAGSAAMIDIKLWLIDYLNDNGSNPVILRKEYTEKNQEEYLVRVAGEFALLLVDSQINGIWIENPDMSAEYNNRLSFHILQASRNRITSTEYIACPSCGRTKFDIQAVLNEVKARTPNLKGLKIAVMGCIVNGPGEMADADYGYIGAGNGTVTIYKGKEVVLKNVDADRAVDALLNIIMENGDWKEA